MSPVGEIDPMSYRARIPKPKKRPHRFRPSKADDAVATLMRLSRTQQQLDCYCQIVVRKAIEACLHKLFCNSANECLVRCPFRRMLRSSPTSTRTNCMVQEDTLRRVQASWKR